jgi:hypothetical protein
MTVPQTARRDTFIGSRRRKCVAVKVRGPAIAQLHETRDRWRTVRVRRDQPRIEQRTEIRAAVGGEHGRGAAPALAFGVAAAEVDAAAWMSVLSAPR